MQQVFENLYVGSQEDEADLSTVHAAKTPFHQQAVGYEGALPGTHPHYLTFTRSDDFGDHLYLNMVDAPKEFMPKFADPMFRAAIEFIRDRVESERVMVRCNQGYSRSPSIALAYLANAGKIANESYDAAAEEFKGLYKNYQPGLGVSLYMRNNWDALMGF